MALLIQAASPATSVIFCPVSYQGARSHSSATTTIAIGTLTWYLPRSRSGITSAISAIAVTMSPPAGPHRNEPVMNTIADTWKTTLRPNRSPNYPTSTVETVSASRYDVTTHDMCAASRA